jgi:hypothetical protein
LAMAVSDETLVLNAIQEQLSARHDSVP